MDSKKSTDIVGMAEQWFEKLPALPAKAVDTLAGIMPWIAVIFGVLGVLVGLSGLGVLTVLAPLAGLGGAASRAGLGLISTIALIISSVMMLAAFPGLKSFKTGGWTLLFWSEIVGVVGSLLVFSIPGVLWGIVGLYIIFQIKPKYK